MSAFASEAGVRLQVQVEDVGVASSELVAACIGEAHERVLAELRGDVDVESPVPALVQSETLISAAILLRALATRDATQQVELQIGGQRIDGGQKFASLMSMARRFEKEGAALLAPFVVRPSVARPGDVTATTAVLGG